MCARERERERDMKRQILRGEFTLGFYLLLMFECVHASAPQYNISWINHYTPAGSLRSQNSGLHVLPKLNTKWADRAFAHVPGHHYGIDKPRGNRDIPTAESFKSNLIFSSLLLVYVIFLLLVLYCIFVQV